MHHPVFSEFECFRGNVPAGFHANFLGVLARNVYQAGMFAARGWQFPDSGRVETNPPVFDEEYFEWIDVLETALQAHEQFTMIELGAGYGRWLVNAASAVRQRRPELALRLIGVEAEPTHFDWMKRHFADNGLDPLAHRLLEAAVDAEERTVGFYVGMPDAWWGQRIAEPAADDVSVRQVKTVSLLRILADLDVVDLIDLDVEGAELVILRSAIDELSRKVKRVHVGTHTREVERGLRTLFWTAGWYKRNDYEVGRAELTAWGEIYFDNGVQTWINPALALIESAPFEIAWLQSAIRSADTRYGQALEEIRKTEALETLRVELEARLRVIEDELVRKTEALEHVRAGLEARLRVVEDELAREAGGWDRVRAMETSKFWRARVAWFRLKRILGLAAGE